LTRRGCTSRRATRIRRTVGAGGSQTEAATEEMTAWILCYGTWCSCNGDGGRGSVAAPCHASTSTRSVTVRPRAAAT
jgi:hypothetical protein